LETADSAATVAGAADFSDVAGAEAFGAGTDFDAVLAGAAAAFFGAALAAVVFFETAEAADLLDVVVLLFVLTVLAFSLLVGDAGAVDLATGGFPPPVGRAARGDAIEDFLAGAVCCDAGDATGAFATVSGLDDAVSLFSASGELPSSTAPLAAASNSDEVITLRLGDATSLSATGSGFAGFEDTLETGALAAFAVTFFWESVIASTS
jgi:hypothetical protein